MGELEANDLEAAGLYDPAAPDAAAQLELLTFLAGLGATLDEMVEARDGLPGLASIVTIRGGPALTLAEAVERSGASEDELRQLTRAAGFAEPGEDDRAFGPGFLDIASGMAAAEQLFGEETVQQLVRVMGSAMSRVADALVSAFLVNVEPASRGKDPVGMALARANAEAGGLVSLVMATLDYLLRQHLLAARRTILDEAIDAGYESQCLAVGFVDLVGSTNLALRLETRELGAVLTEFENRAADVITAAGGRVVKLIGDEILFTAPDEHAGCAIALELTATFADHPRVPPVRAGIAVGDVLLRDGDVFGPVVNLAARAVKVAGPGELVAPPEAIAAAGLQGTPVDAPALKGFDASVELTRVR